MLHDHMQAVRPCCHRLHVVEFCFLQACFSIALAFLVHALEHKYIVPQWVGSDAMGWLRMGSGWMGWSGMGRDVEGWGLVGVGRDGRRG